MEREKLLEIRGWVRKELESAADFWLKNGLDREHGGVYTCLDRQGNIFSTDKSVWMQGRCGWTYAYLCRVYGVRPEWLAASKSCIDFLEDHCVNRAAGGRLYFTVTAEGKPLRQRRYCFSGWRTRASKTSPATVSALSPPPGPYSGTRTGRSSS